MLDFLEILERANSGPKMTEKEFDFLYYKKTEEIRKKYHQIRVPETDFINLDDDVADSVFEAGIELLIDTGGYCVTTNKVIKWTEDEIREGLKGINNEAVFGEGRDQRIFFQRNVEDSRLPRICPGFHAPYTEDIIPDLIKTVAMIPEADIIEGPNFPNIEGYRIWGTPFEVYAARRQVGWLREGITKVGRPGMGILAYPLSPKGATLISVLDPDYGVRRSDGIVLCPLNGQKLEYEYLATAVAGKEFGCNIVGGGLPAGIGGYSGEPEGGAIGVVAHQIVGVLAYHINVGSTSLSWILTNKEREREAIWANSASTQALIRNTNLPLLQYVTHLAGPCTQMCLQEVAAKVIEMVIDGGHIAKHTCTTVTPRWNNVQTPTETLWMIDVAHSTVHSGLKRADANEVVGKLFMKFKDKLDNPPRGKGILDCYDLRTRTPSKEFQKIRERTEKELAEMGLELQH